MVKKIFSKTQSRSRLGKHGHDLSRRLCFTSSCGHLLPVLFDYLSPSDSINIQSDLFTRTQPLKTPAFVRVNEHIDYFFVPMKLIDSYFGNAFYGISDFSNPNDNVNPSASSTTFVAPAVLVTHPLSTFQAKFLKGNYTHNPGDILSGEEADEFGIGLHANLARLLSHLGYGERVAYSSSPVDAKYDTQVNLYPFAVYQRIFSDFYRDSEFTSNNPYNYSLNQFYSNGNAFTSKLEAYFTGHDGFFKLRYHRTPRDFFTSYKNTPMFSSASSIGSYGSDMDDTEGSMLLSSYGINPEITNKNADLYNQGMSKDGVFIGDSNIQQTSFINLAAIRTAYAIDKLRRITANNGKHYDAQTLAHFGFNVPRGVSDETYYLGSHSQVLQIGEVVSTATTGQGDNTSTLGQLAGRGASRGQSKVIKFTAPCHGFLMAIYSAVPELQYNNFGVDKLNLYSSINDFYHPEFDRLGMQPYYMVQFNNSYTSNSKVFLGWNYRYLELKTSFDKVIGAFNYTLRDWVPTLNNGYQTAYLPVNDVTTYFKYVSPCYLDSVFELSFSTDIGTDNPSFAWGAVIHDKLISLSPTFERDPLLHSLQFKYYKSSIMSPHGDPLNM